MTTTTREASPVLTDDERPLVFYGKRNAELIARDGTPAAE